MTTAAARFGSCSTDLPHDLERREAGVDDRYGEVTVFRCTRCGRCWLRYFIEYEYLSASGRWFEGEISPAVAASLTANDAVGVFATMESYLRGGSAFTAVRRTTGPLEPWLTPFPGK